MRGVVAIIGMVIVAASGVAMAEPAPVPVDQEPVRDVVGIEAPYAIGVVGRFGDTALAFRGRHATARELGIGGGATVGGHLGLSYNVGQLYAESGAEWTLIPGVGEMPQAWLTVGASLPTTGSVVMYAGPSLRLYDLVVSRNGDPWASGPSFALTGELGVRALLWHSYGRRRPTTTGFYLRGNVPFVGGSGWTATICIVGGPAMRLD